MQCMSLPIVSFAYSSLLTIPTVWCPALIKRAAILELTYNQLFICTYPRLTLLFKIMRGLLEVPARCIRQLTPYAATRAHHPLKLKYIYSRTDLHRNSFLLRSICTWNDLNIANIDTISLNDFKKVLIQ